MEKIKTTIEIDQEAIRYRQFMLANGYSAKTTENYRSYVLRYLSWPEQGNELCLQKSIFNYLKAQYACNLKGFKGHQAALYLYFRMITGKRYKKPTAKKYNPEIDAILQRFHDYSVNIKRIQQNSALQEVKFTRNFLEYITGEAPYSSENITAHNIRDFVVSRLATLKDSSKGREITAIRNFFRFQEFEGIPTQKSIFRMPLSPAVWKNCVYPKTINESVFNRLHEIPDDNKPTGIRDRCIMLCFTELALRCIEVASLTIDDFNWNECCVAIKNTKNHLDRKLPVSKKLGQAIIAYLKNARPETANRILFVRFKHIHGEPMGTEQIRGVVRRIYAKTGVEIKSTGTHILRRTAATKIYNAGNSLKLTADILGHGSLDSTVRYVKTDIAGLIQVAAPWPQTSDFQPDDIQFIGKAGIHDVK